MQQENNQQEALKKFKSLVEEIRICMFITNSSENDHTRPMATADVDQDGGLWFFTDVRSIKVEEVAQDGRVHLVYAHPGKDSYLDVWGKAIVTTDKEKLKEKWSPVVKAFFPKGVDDPNLGLLRVIPQQVYFWDAGTSSMTSMFKMAAAMFTGNPAIAKGEEGKLHL